MRWSASSLHFTVNPKPLVWDFIDRASCLRGKECSINRFQQVEPLGYSGTSDRIRWAGQVAGRPDWGLHWEGRGLLIKVTQHFLPSDALRFSVNKRIFVGVGAWALRLYPRAQITK